jgi:hypothetical protein
VFENRVMRRIQGVKREQGLKASGENYIKRNFIICTYGE